MCNDLGYTATTSITTKQTDFPSSIFRKSRLLSILQKSLLLIFSCHPFLFFIILKHPSSSSSTSSSATGLFTPKS